MVVFKSTSLQNFSLPSFFRAASRSMTFDTARKVCSILGVLWSVETTVCGFDPFIKKENRSLGQRSRHLEILEFFDFMSGISAQTTQILSGHLQEVTHQDTISTFWGRENVWIDLAALLTVNSIPLKWNTAWNRFRLFVTTFDMWQCSWKS